MDMLYRQNKEPLNRLRAAVPVAVHKTLEQLLGLIIPPTDQSSCATVVSNMTSCLIEYGKSICHVRDEFSMLMLDAATIQTAMVEGAVGIQGQPPGLCMYKRVNQFEAWTLLSETPLTGGPIRMAVGAEIAQCLLCQRTAHEPHFRQLRKAMEQYGRRPQNEVPLVDDLVDLNFGKDWFPKYVRNDSIVRQSVELPDPDGPPRSRGVVAKRPAELMMALRNRSLHIDVKHRQASMDDSHLTPDQFLNAARAIRRRAEEQVDDGAVQALCVLTGWTPKQACSLPLLQSIEETDSVALDVGKGLICVNLSHLLPGRRMPGAMTSHLFHQSSDWLKIPIPDFLAGEIQRRSQINPDAILFGDLVHWTPTNHRESVIDGDPAKLKSSLSRTARTTGAYAIHVGLSRLVAANLGLDYSLIASSRMYYARVTSEEIVAGASELYERMDWGGSSAGKASTTAFGSHYVLTMQGAQSLFNELATSCRNPWPGRRGSAKTLLAHHKEFTIYVVALLSFCLGLREARDYQIQVVDVSRGQCHLRIHDKHGGDRMMAQISRLNKLVVEQVRLYLAHCNVLMRRLSGSSDPAGLKMLGALSAHAREVGPLFLIPRQSGRPEPAGSANTWLTLPLQLRVPGNAGRHFWQNVFRERGLSSGDIDRFMRHRVVGLENNSTASLAQGAASFERIDVIQVAVLNEMGVQPVGGLAGVAK